MARKKRKQKQKKKYRSRIKKKKMATIHVILTKFKSLICYIHTISSITYFILTSLEQP